MAILVSGLFLVVYLIASRACARNGGSAGPSCWAARSSAGRRLVLADPELAPYSVKQGSLRLSNRDEIWSFYYDQFLQSPLFGRGLGAGFVGGDYRLDVILPAPHNEYLHLLVVGGVVGSSPAWWRSCCGSVSCSAGPQRRSALSDRASAGARRLCDYRQRADLPDRTGAVRLSRGPAHAVRTSPGVTGDRLRANATNRRASAVLALQHGESYVSRAGRARGAPAVPAERSRS